jgi:hypothetical protein
MIEFMNKEKRLIPRLTCCGSNDLCDFLQLIAANIETSMLQAGAIPNKDYTRLDLFKMAQPYALQRFKRNELTYIDRWVEDGIAHFFTPPPAASEPRP